MMYPVGGYYAVPNPVEIRELYAGTKAEKAGAAEIERNKAARDIVDEVNFVRYEMSRLDGTEFDTDAEKKSVAVDAQPKKANFFQKVTGIGLSPVDDIASQAKGKKDEVATVEGILNDKEMDVTVNFANKDEALVYSKIESEDGAVFFQRGNETVGLDANGNLVMGSI